MHCHPACRARTPRAPLLPLTWLACAASFGAFAAAAGAQHAELDAPHFQFDTALYPEGGGPWESVIVDIDRDGIPDLATVSWPFLNPRLSVLRGDGRGGFAAPELYPLLDASHGIAAGDFNGDGWPDLAASITGKNFDNRFVSVFLNRGDGTLTATGPFDAGFGPTGLAAGDFDGDGDVDLAAAHDVDIVSIRRFAFLRNQGAGTFDPPVIRSLPRTSFAAAAGDLNGDAFADLVIAGEGHDVSVLLGTPEGPGAATGMPAMPALGFDPFPTVALADIDRDSDLDILFTAELAATSPSGGRGLVGILRNRGDGTFTPAETVRLGDFTSGATGVAAADVTGDGWPDLLAAQGRDNLWTLVAGDGTGGFAASAQTWNVNEYPTAVHAADADGDGDLDVVCVGKGSQTASVHLNPGSGSFPRATTTQLTSVGIVPSFSSLLRCGDLDRDGDLDAVVGYASFFSTEWGLAVRLGNGDGTFGPLRTYPTSVWPQKVELADVNGDGFLDVLWIDDQFDKAVHWNLNRGDGTFGPAEAGPTRFCAFDAMAVGDLNEDGRPDVVAVSCGNQAGIALATPSGYGAWRLHPMFDFATAVELADLDADGHLDLVTNSALFAYLEVFRGNGDGTFGAGNSFACGGDVAAVVAADLNGDGVLDLATAEENTNSMSVLLGRGGALFRPPVTYAAPSSDTVDNFDEIDAVDVDGDGDLDLVVASFGSQDVALWRNRGNGSFQHQVRLGVQHQAVNAVPGDYDLDGAMDLLVLVRESVRSTRWWLPATVLLRNLGADPWTDLGQALAGTGGVAPVLTGQSTLLPALPIALRTTGARPGAPGALVLGTRAVGTPLLGGVLVPEPTLAVPFVTDADGEAVLATRWPGAPSGATLVAQSWLLDAGAPQGVSATNAVRGTVP